MHKQERKIEGKLYWPRPLSVTRCQPLWVTDTQHALPCTTTESLLSARPPSAPKQSPIFSIRKGVVPGARFGAHPPAVPLRHSHHKLKQWYDLLPCFHDCSSIRSSSVFVLLRTCACVCHSRLPHSPRNNVRNSLRHSNCLIGYVASMCRMHEAGSTVTRPSRTGFTP